MTLPFRRRHNDHEASHDRARALITTGFLQPNGPADADWLEAHLAGCLECRTDHAAYGADRELLRALREQAPEPPRDLWARTAAAIEREGGRRTRNQRRDRLPRSWRIGHLPAGVASGLLVVLVVVGASLIPRGGVPFGPTPAGSDTAVTPQSEATPMAVVAEALAWVQVAEDGTFEFRQASVNEVCPDLLARCALLDSAMTTRLAITAAPQAVLLSPTGSEIVVVTSSGSAAGTDIVVLPVPTVPPPPETAVPSASTDPSTTPSTSPPSAPPSAASTPRATPTESPATPTPSGLPTQSPDPSASPDSSAGYSIVTGVVVVGDVAYSPDGLWLAFSARPAFGVVGPDLYLWRVGDPLARAVTDDHRTFFSGWLGGQVLANRVETGMVAGDPSATPAAPTPSPAPTPTPSADPNTTPTAIPAVVEDHPVVFLLDPETLATTPVAGTDVWRPTVDPTGRSVVYWSGTLIPDGTGTGWSLGTGSLVIDGWQDGSVPLTDDQTAQPGTTAAPTSTPSALPVETDASGARVAPAIGPAGHPVILAEGPTTGFNAWFDPSGTRLAVWVADPSDPAVGTLRLVVLDEDTREIDPTTDPLPGAAALHGVSINGGRLAWVTPPGQDGEGSHLQILAWSGREFGQIRSIQAQGLSVVR